MATSGSLFRDNQIEFELGRKSVRSGAASIAARALNAAVQVGSVLFLARLLSPEDYGLVGMVTAVTGFAPVLVSLGTPDAVTQRHSVSENEISALFWLSISVGTAFALLVAACGPLVSWFYSEPRLTPIALVSALTFVMCALHCQHYALLRRAMRFQELGVLDVASNVLSACIAIGMALFGFHYWALALRPITLNAFLAIGVWWRSGWLPKTPSVTSGVKEMVKLGLNISGFTLTDFAGRSADRIAIGYKSGARTLGFYQNALFIYENLLDVMVTPLHGVAVAGLSKVVGDPRELRRLWAKALSTLEFYSMPAFGLLAVTSQDIVVVLLGKKWAGAGLLLTILAIRGIPHTIERTLGWLHVAAGRTDRWMRWGVLSTLVHFGALMCGLPFGAKGIATAYVICMFVLFIPALVYAGKPLGIGVRDVIQVVWRPLTGALIATVAAMALRVMFLNSMESAILRSMVLAVVYVGVYLLVTVGILRVTTPLGVILTLAKDVLPQRASRFVPTPRFVVN